MTRHLKALERELGRRRLDYMTFCMGETWHALVAPRGTLMQGGRNEYQTGSTEARALRRALAAMKGKR